MVKLFSDEHAAALHNENIIGGIQGGSLGLALWGGLHYYGRRKATYANLPLPAKVLGCVLITLPFAVAQAERRGVLYERTLWQGVGLQELKNQEAREQVKASQLSTSEAAKDWLLKNKYALVGGAWAVCIVGSFAAVANKPGLTTTQKIVQARMVAQFSTIALVLAAAGLSYQAQDAKKDRAMIKEAEHSWAHIIETEEAELKKENEKRAAEGKPLKKLPQFA